MKKEIAFIIHEYNLTCKNTPIDGVCSNCYRIAGQVCFVISQKFEKMFLEKL